MKSRNTILILALCMVAVIATVTVQVSAITAVNDTCYSDYFAGTFWGNPCTATAGDFGNFLNVEDNDVTQYPPMSTELVTGPQRGSAYIDPGGWVVDQPDFGDYTPDQLTYRVTDANGDSAVATVFLIREPHMYQCDAADASFTMPGNSVLFGNNSVLSGSIATCYAWGGGNANPATSQENTTRIPQGNMSRPVGGSRNVTIHSATAQTPNTSQEGAWYSFSSPSHGEFYPNRDGEFVYKPYVGFVGTDSFTYYFTYDSGEWGWIWGLPGTATINVTAPLAPTPTVSVISPVSSTVGSPAFTLTVTGTGFYNGSIVRWNESDRTTTYVSAKQVKAAIPATDLLAPGIMNVTVFNPGPGGGSSNVLPFVIHLVPAISSVSPVSASTGGPDFTLTLTGTGFLPTSVVQWNGAERVTTYLSPTQISAVITAADLASTGVGKVTVFNPGTTGGTSPVWKFSVKAIPSISAITPAYAPAGSPALTLIVTGTGYYSGSIVRWNEANRTTTYVSAKQVKAAIPASDLLAPGIVNVTVFNPDTLGGVSNATPFAIRIIPTISSVSPASAGAGGPDFTLTVNGTNFLPESVVRWNGVDKVTTYLSPAKLSAAIPAADIATPNISQVTVFNPGASGGTSRVRLFTVNAKPSISTITPGSAPAGSPTLTLTVDGTNFLSTSTVRWNNANRVTTYVSPTRLTTSITDADLTASGVKYVNVLNPGSLGGLSNTKIFYVQLIPTITSLTPSTVAHGGKAFILTVEGTNFLSTSRVKWNGVLKGTTYVSPTRLNASITAADILNAGQKPVTVINAGITGGTSDPVTFTVT